MAKLKTPTAPLAGDYESMAARLPGAALDWMGDLRGRALATYRAHGLPDRRVEAWRYTNLNGLAKLGFAPVEETESAVLDAVPEGAPLAVDGAWRIVFVNGRLRADLSDLDNPPAGVAAVGLADLLAHDPAALEGRLTDIPEGREGALAALNTVFMRDGLVLRIADGASVETPIHLISIGAPAGDGAIAFHMRNLVTAGKASTATLVESHIGGGGAYFSNSVADVVLEEGAALTHAKLQDEGAAAFHVALTRATLAGNAVYDSFVLHRGAELARHEIHAAIEGGGAECRLNGAYLGAGRQHIDNTTVIEHKAAGSTSREVYKGALDGHARGVFQGRITVHRDAQQSNGHQLNKTLLLSRNAEIDSKPELEIFADDVKCSHGATVGELDETALFYMRSRGIDETSARDMLVSAFLTEAVGELRHEALAGAFAGRIAGWVDERHDTREEAA